MGALLGFKRCVGSCISPALMAIARLCGKYLESSILVVERFIDIDSDGYKLVEFIKG